MRTVLGWAGAGLLWGVVARAWMRLISTSPEFTWSGTLFILQVAGIAGLLVGVSRALRARGRHRAATAVGALALLPIGAGQGAVLIPAVAFATVAAPGPLPRWPVRVLLSLLAGLTAVGLVGPAPVAAAAAAVPLIAGRWLRPVAAVLAVVAYALVVWSFVPGLPLSRVVAGAVLYALLLGAAVAAYVAAVRGGDGRARWISPPRRRRPPA